MEHGIVLKQGILLPEKTVLCDDTLTSGATMKGALNALEKKPGKLRIYTVSINRTWVKK